MSWKDILKEDLKEKVIEALAHFYGSREEVPDSVHSDSFDTKDDVKRVIRGMRLAAEEYNHVLSDGDIYNHVKHDEGYQKMQEALKKLL